ncbi:unnamed protein product [Closterium sp. NIES-53]
MADDSTPLELGAIDKLELLHDTAAVNWASFEDTLHTHLGSVIIQDYCLLDVVLEHPNGLPPVLPPPLEPSPSDAPPPPEPLPDPPRAPVHDDNPDRWGANLNAYNKLRDTYTLQREAYRVAEEAHANANARILSYAQDEKDYAEELRKLHKDVAAWRVADRRALTIIFSCIPSHFKRNSLLTACILDCLPPTYDTYRITFTSRYHHPPLVADTYHITFTSRYHHPPLLPQATTTAEEVAAQVAPAVVVVDVVVGEEEDVMVAEVVAVVGVADTPHPRAPSPLCQYIIRYGSNKVQHLLPSSTPTPTPPPTPPPQASPLHYPPPYAGWPYPPYPPPGYGHGPTAPTANLAEQPSSSSNPPGFTPFPIGHVSTAPADSLYAHTINESLFQYFAFSSSSSCLEFILDSGATHTVLRDAGTLVPLHTPSTIHGADSSFTITSRHTSTLPCPIFPSGTVTGLYIPSLRNNLVALCDLTRFGITALFPGHAHHCDLFHTTTGRFICRIPL